MKFATTAEPIGTVHVGAPITVADSHGDCWVPAWTAEGTVFSPSDDTYGFRRAGDSNIAFNRLEGDDVAKLNGATVNLMTAYGKSAEEGPDGCTWKSSGCYALNGVIYWVVARHKYGETSGDPQKRHSVVNVPGGRFATPYFVQYGQDGRASADNADRYVYAISNNGFWDSGDNQILGRVPREKIGELRGTDWEFYQGGNGMEDCAWSYDMNQAKLILDAPGKLGMTGAVFIPALKRYLMIGWYYPAGGGKLAGASVKTIWDFYEAPKPWGPWTKFGAHEFQPQGYYCPVIFPKFTSRDGRVLFAMTAGNWKDQKVYHLTIVPFQLELPR